MTIDAWLEAALADAERRNLPDLKPLLRGLAESTRRLRSADWNDDASGHGRDAAPRRTADQNGTETRSTRSDATGGHDDG